MSRRFLLAGGVAVVVSQLVPALSGVLLALVGGTVVATVLAGTTARPSAYSRPWRLIALGLAIWVLADIALTIGPGRQGLLWSQTASLAGYPLIIGGLAALVRVKERGRRDLAGVLDALTVAVALGTLAWFFVAAPVLASADLGTAEAHVPLLFLVGDIVLVGGITRVGFGIDRQNAASRLLLSSLVLIIVGDLADVLTVSTAASVQQVADAAHLLGYVVLGGAVMHPSLARLGDVVPPRAFSVRLRLSLAGICACLPAVGLAVQQVIGLRPDVLPALGATMVISGLLMARQQLAFDQVARVTAQTIELRDQLAYEATHDALTLLPNRAHGLTLLQEALDRIGPRGLVTVMFVDLDGFKKVNDTFGHAVGDQLLRRVGERLRQSVRGEDVAIRLGGDEFVVVLESLDGTEQALAVAERLIESVSRPVNLGPAGTARVGASVGIASCDDPAADAAALLDEADVAAYRAKTEGKGRAVVFDDDLRSSVVQREQRAAELRRALAEDQLVLHYQPVIDALSGDVRGYESLVRWQHPTAGLLQPADFLPVAEASDLMGDLDRWVLRHAATQLQDWVQQHGFDHLVVAVNVSPTSAARGHLVHDVRSALQSSGLRPDRLVLELPERVLHDPVTVGHLDAVRDLGVAISISDFGSGVDALARLSHLPVNVVKISRSSLDLDTPLGDRLLRLMIQGAHAVGLNAIAEGVEHDAQLATLRALDCEMVQGFHIAHPMPADQVPDYHGVRNSDRFSGLRR